MGILNSLSGTYRYIENFFLLSTISRSSLGILIFGFLTIVWLEDLSGLCGELRGSELRMSTVVLIMYIPWAGEQDQGLIDF